MMKQKYNTVFCKATTMANTAGITLQERRRCGRQMQCSNVLIDNDKEYVHRRAYLLYVDALLGQISTRSGKVAKQSVKALCLLPNNHLLIDEEVIRSIYDSFRDDLPAPDEFQQEC